MASAEAPATRTTTVSANYDGPRADVALESSDAVHFRVRRLELVANSGLFDGMFSDLDDAGNEQASTGGKGELPVVAVSETAKELELFLPFLCRGQARPSPLDFDQILDLLRMSDKYDAAIITDCLTMFLQPFVATRPMEVFSLGIIYGQRDLVKSALRSFATPPPGKNSAPIKTVKCHACPREFDNPFNSPCPCGVTYLAYASLPAPIYSYHIQDVPEDLFDRICAISPRSLQRFSRFQEDVLRKVKTWNQVAEEW